jgi:uncharacterized membrane protein
MEVACSIMSGDESSLILDILTRTGAHSLPYLVDGAFWLIGTGLAGALAAAVFGVLDFRASAPAGSGRMPGSCRIRP